MKLFITLIFFLFLINCSLNNDSKYWTENVDKRKEDKKELLKIIEKSKDITTMTTEEYKIYIDEHTKKSKYPDLNQ